MVAPRTKAFDVRTGKGYLGSPYDSELHNAYRLSGQQDDIKQYHLDLAINPKNRDQVQARVWHQLNGKKEILANNFWIGGYFYLGGNQKQMPKKLKITRLLGGKKYQFDYGVSSDGPRWFSFKSNEQGNGVGAWEGRKGPPMERYCKECATKSSVTLQCSFPGW